MNSLVTQTTLNVFVKHSKYLTYEECIVFGNTGYIHAKRTFDCSRRDDTEFEKCAKICIEQNIIRANQIYKNDILSNSVHKIKQFEKLRKTKMTDAEIASVLEVTIHVLAYIRLNSLLKRS